MKRPVKTRETWPGAAPVLPEDLIAVVERDHVPAVLAYATVLTGDRAAAEDVVQETLVRAWRHRASLTAGQGSLRGWLLTVARNVVIDGARRPSPVLADVTAVPVADHAGPVTDRVTVTRALRHLHPRHREVLFRLYFQDRSVAQTAAELGLAEGTVKSRTHYAVRALRRQLLQDEEAA